MFYHGSSNRSWNSHVHPITSGLSMSPAAEEKPKAPKPSQCDFFAPRPVAGATPSNSAECPPKSGESGSLSRITKAFVSSVEKAKNGEKYQPPRRSAPEVPSPVKKEKSTEAKKAFMPAFIKTTAQAAPTQSGQRYTSLGATGHFSFCVST